MRTEEISAFIKNIPKTGAMLGFDLGHKNIGLAVSDGERIVAVPLKIIKWRGRDAFIKEISAVIRDKNINAMVFGWPLLMGGKKGKNCRVVERLAQEMQRHPQTALPVLLWDERRSSLAIEALGGNKDKIDALAASLILQSALDAYKWANKNSV